jgi:hypothetical protein
LCGRQRRGEQDLRHTGQGAHMPAVSRGSYMQVALMRSLSDIVPQGNGGN